MIACKCVSHLSCSYYLTSSLLFKCYIIRAAKSMTRSLDDDDDDRKKNRQERERQKKRPTNFKNLILLTF